MTERFCSDCVYRRRTRHIIDFIIYPIATWNNSGGHRWICVRDFDKKSQGPVNPVTGRIKRNNYVAPSCNLEREFYRGINGESCGPEGKFWKPRDTKRHLFTILKKI